MSVTTILIILLVLLLLGGGFGYYRGGVSPAQPVGWLINIVVLVLVILLVLHLTGSVRLS